VFFFIRVFLPGGATFFNQSNGYADAGQLIYEIAIELNEAGTYFPVFGTCLGFELLIILASGRGEPENRVSCYSISNKPLDFTGSEEI
jgi:gamma-glutamyl hydrolase